MTTVHSAQLFFSKENAQEHKATMRGYGDIRIRKDTQAQPHAWYITTEKGTLCDDGFVRKLR